MSGTHNVLPAPSLAAMFGGGRTIRMALDNGKASFYSSGRVALREALRGFCRQATDEVLLPAYHCLSMVDAVRAVPATPVFYRVDESLAPVLDDVERQLGARTRVVVGVHYFGRPQSLEATRGLAARQGLALVEDCAHTLFGTADGVPVGAAGTLAVTSLRKFFPAFDGGAIVEREGARARRPRRGWKHELRGLYNLLEELLAPAPRAPATAAVSAAAGTGTDRDYHDSRYAFDEPGRAMSLASRLVMALASQGRLVEKRRAAYESLAAHLAQVAGVRSFWRDGLAAETVPYVYPLLLTGDADATYRAIRSDGIAAYRWEMLATQRCEQSNEYARRLIQLPCHQELIESDVAMIAATVKAAVTQPNSGRQL